jgi:hypothetical protein
MEPVTAIESRKDYRSKWAYWDAELKGSRAMLSKWHKQSEQINARYLDQRGAADTPTAATAALGKGFKLNLFYANASTQQQLLYGKLPRVDVARSHADSEDDVARVAAVILERMLNQDIEDDPNATDTVLRSALQDRLIPGLGVGRVRYDLDGEQELAPIDYVNWQDVLWGWSRTFDGLPWMAYRTYQTRDEATSRYGADTVRDFDFRQQKMYAASKEVPASDDPERDDENWQKAEIWSIWDKATRTVIEYHHAHKKLLKTTPDPLQLQRFFPSPPFFIANATTALYRPTPDFHMAQDLYNEVDKLQTRIAIITEAVKVIGLYDKSNPEVGRMFKEGRENDLIPVDNWALLAEKGGIQGQVDWFPIKDVVDALINLRQLRDETIQLLYQVTGMSDIMRGQLDNQYEGVGQSRDKMQFASIRLQALQESFATFASGLFQLKAEIIARHFEPAAIIRQSNASKLPEAETPEGQQLIAAAVELIKSPEARLRVSIKAESLAIMDYQRLQAERTEFLAALGGFIQASAPLIEQAPESKPFLMRLLQWGLSGYRGADEIEGVIDAAIKAQEQADQQPKPDPEAQKEQAKAQGQLQLVQAKAQAEIQTRQNDLQADIQTAQAEHQMKLAEMEADTRAKLALIEAKANSDMQVEAFQSEVNAQQARATTGAELEKDIITTRVNLDAEAEKVALKIRETQATESIKAAGKLATEKTGD